MSDLPFERGKTRGLWELARLSSLLIVLEVRVGSARAPSVLCGRSIQTPDKAKVSERQTATTESVKVELTRCKRRDLR